jgi:hypothetical protein
MDFYGFTLKELGLKHTEDIEGKKHTLQFAKLIAVYFVFGIFRANLK